MKMALDKIRSACTPTNKETNPDQKLPDEGDNDGGGDIIDWKEEEAKEIEKEHFDNEQVENEINIPVVPDKDDEDYVRFDTADVNTLLLFVITEIMRIYKEKETK